MARQLRPKYRTLSNPSLVHFFSTSRDPSTTPNPPPDESSSTTSQPSQSQSSTSSYFSDIKAKLRQQQQQQHSQQLRRPSTQFSASGQVPPPKVSLEEIRKNLSEYRRRSAPPNPADSPSSQPISVNELLKRNVFPKGVEPGNEPGPPKPAAHLSFDAIRESLKQLRNNTSSRTDKRGGDPLSLSSLKDSLKLKPGGLTPSPGSTAIGGTDRLPLSVFGKEMKERKSKESGGGTGFALKTEFLKMYNYEDLGERLRQLRPEGLDKGKVGFSLEELNERLGKLREMEEQETDERMAGFGYRELRESLQKLKMSEEEKTKQTAIQRLNILEQASRTPDYMSHPPKEQLLEQYFHLDNMSSEEKMKLELAKVREEFKMSESDCGSARVQVAQLTTKIKHLSSVLHKKDKHSRKGLEEMVQRRKKLLKYLRRTDWDSYCLVLSRLGLRDNPDLKR
ncbi:uncharacterized protein LOC116199706 isoform X2 [Punica granatum]|uniref:Small ribosomal subunit protein uS15c n=2 Tax=Punica granatum TaxID=22663 RepID=A0A218WB75_PUNGR|nr:uncharacterized protein LOC116199706 isoform X2 [Punica granatum]OWM69590.1 hypothetical protein CDL15_Pgr014051 [Punica granatum]PKI31558.1 hypothetical protein CRG98_048042 [Punica granatum]